MSFEWPLDPQELFHERTAQMLASGLPPADLAMVRGAVTDMWRDGPGGWTHEWSKLAGAYADRADHSMAAMLFGWAKFPTLANDRMRQALARQLDHVLLGTATLPVNFERRMVDVSYGADTTSMPIHIYSHPGLPADAPVVLMSGGVDTWKMDIGRMLAGFAAAGFAHVWGFDIAGTGESRVPMDSEKGADSVRGLAASARASGARRVAYFGISMGGHFSARAALQKDVDVAVNLGGPVRAAFGGTRTTRFGMDGIVMNAAGYDALPSAEEQAKCLASFSLDALLSRRDSARMLVVNGADDVHVPIEDTLVFEGWPTTEVIVFPGAGHCATEKWAEIMPMITRWLGEALA